MVESYERLLAWRECHRLVIATYRATRSFPDGERFGLVSQTRRAAFSAAANIVEGSLRRSKREFRRFLNISHASLGELGYGLLVARDAEMLTQEGWGELNDLRQRASFLVWRLFQSLA